VLVASIAVPGAAGGADLNATPATLASVFASAQGGDVIHLASGSYGSFSGGAKASTVTLMPQSGATVQISLDLGSSVTNLRIDGLRVGGGEIVDSRNVVVANSVFTGPITVRVSQSGRGIVLDRDTFDGLGVGANEGRISLIGPGSGVTVSNGHIGNGGCSDGIQLTGSISGAVISGNEFSGLRQGSCTTHSDPIQFYGAEGTVVDGNYFHDNSTAIMTPDGNGDNTTVRNNVFVMDEYPWAYVGGGDVGSKLTHNVVVGGSLRIYGGNQNQASRDTVLRDNVSVIEASGTNITVDHNMQPNQVTFMGGSGRNAYLLANSSAGKGAASDGLDVGILSGSTAPAPPPPASDTTAPETTIASGPTGTTNDNTPTFAFSSSKANSVFECRVDSGSWVDCASPWTTVALSDGSHSVAVRATDVAGNTDASPATRSFTISTAPAPDTAAPDTTITSGPTGMTSDATPTFAFSSSEANSVFECQVDSASWADCTSPWTTAALSDGAHSVSVRATDVAGNTDASPATRAFTVSAPPPPDTTAPDTAIASGPTGTTSDSTSTFAFSSSEANATYECRVDSAAWATCTSPWTTTALSDGAHSVSVRATDAAGNTDASPATRAFTVATGPPPDTTAPDTTITSGPTGTTSTTSASFAFSSSDAGSTFECKLDAAAYAACSSPKAYSALSAGAHSFSVRAIDAAGNADATPATQSWTIQDAPPADGQPVAEFSYSPAAPAIGQAVAFDASSATCDDTPCTYTWVDDGPDGPAGRQWPLGQGKTMTFTFQGEGVKYVRLEMNDADGDADSTMKPITVASSPASDATAPETTIGSGPTGTTSNSTPTFAFSSSEEASAFECRVDSGVWVDCTSPWTTTALDDGPHSVSVRATDAAGNTDATPATRAFAVTTAPASDITPPDTTISSGPDGATSDNTPTFDFAATEPGSAFSCQVDLGATEACASPWTTPVLPDGPHRVAVSATDAAGNGDASPAMRSFRVDTQAPDTTIDPAPPAESSDTSATLTFDADESGASFECRLDWRAWADCTSPKSYSGLWVGRHSAYVRATDAAGNVDASPARARWWTVTP
jgi:hypothetical protein